MLQTYPDKNLNVVSITIKDYLEERPLLPEQSIKFRLLNGVKNIDPARKNKDELLFPSSICIPLVSKFLDPAANKGKGSIIQVGVVERFDEKTETPTFKSFLHTPQKGDGGIFMLSGSSVEDMENYEVLLLRNDNATNPFRDKSVEPTFERVDEIAESKVRTNKRNYLFDSLSAIRSWSTEERRIIGAAYNISTTLAPDILKDRLESIAEADPVTFYKTIDSEDTKLKALIQIAKETGIISFVAHENKWKYSGSEETIVLLDRKEGVNEFDQLKDFLKSSANGTAIVGQLKKLIKENQS